MSTKNGYIEPSVFSEGLSPLEEVAEVMFAHSGISAGRFDPGFRRRRINERTTACGLEDITSYVSLLKASPVERTALLNTFGIQVTEFFRNPEVFALLEAVLLPGLIQELAGRSRKNVRVWSVGCSSGEEAYSMAILLEKTMQNAALRGVVFGSDISESALEAARHATYRRDALHNVRLGTLENCFTSEDDGYRVRDDIRHMVHFSRADITAKECIHPRESIFSGYDIILCRNVLIYYRKDVRKRVVHNLKNSLSNGGYLILGESEHLHEDYRNLFAQPCTSLPIYRKIKESRKT